MKLFTLALLLGVSLGNYVSELIMEKAWKEELTVDWDSLDHVKSWFDWKKTFNKKYDSLHEEAQKFLVFLDNWKLINDHNMNKDNTYTMGINQFSGTIYICILCFYLFCNKHNITMYRN